MKPLTQQYFEAIQSYYNNPKLINFIKQGEEIAKQTTGNSITTKISEGNNLIIRYIVNEENIFILGIATKKGRLNKGDLKSYNFWVEELIKKVKQGYSIYTSPNKLSLPLLIKIVEKLKQVGVHVIKESAGIFTIDGIEWENIIIRKV